MDQGTLSGLVIILLMSLFVGIVIWAWSDKRTRGFREAANLPLQEDDESFTTDKGAHKK